MPDFIIALAIGLLIGFILGYGVRAIISYRRHRHARRQIVPFLSSETGKPTLYERLGGVYSIATVVDDFIDRMHDPILNVNAAVDEAHHRVCAAGFKYYVTEMVCWATGGPQNYTGRSMSESHKHLKITESEWAAFCKDFDDTMAKFNVPEAEHKELFAIVETVGDQQDVTIARQSYCSCSLQVDDQLELGRSFDRQVRWLRPP